MRKFIVPLVVLLGSALTACAPKPSHHSPTSSEQAAVRVVEGQKPSEEQQQVMLKAKEALFSRLSGRLMEVLTKSGPESAIRICKEEAPRSLKKSLNKKDYPSGEPAFDCGTPIIGLPLGPELGLNKRSTHHSLPYYPMTRPRPCFRYDFSHNA